MTLRSVLEGKMDGALAIVLRTGVLVAATVIAIGGAVYLVRFGAHRMDYQVFQQESEDLRHVAGIFHRAAAGSSRGIIQFGLLVLIATPVIRVAAAFGLFLKERDHLYAAITLAVLLILAFGLIGASHV